MIVYDDIRRVMMTLTEMKNDLEAEARELPDGMLFCYTSRGVRNYCERIPKGGNRKKERRIGVGKDPERLRKLVRKEYVRRVFPIIEKDIELCQSLLDGYRYVDENSVMAEFVRKYPELTSMIYKEDFDPETWEQNYSQKNRGKKLYKENLKSLSAAGTSMRSLGEIIIGSRLAHYNIPHRYEAPIPHPDIPFVPDFTIRRPRDGKIIYWEHLGMVNDTDYMNNNWHKFEVYERYGIVPWDNLIISYSQRDGGINEKLIDSLIQGWLL